MELRSLKYFVAVYETGSISGAAKISFVSQPSITSSIQQLESLLSIKLFTRHARGVKATVAADKLYPIAKDMNNGAKSILSLFNDEPSPVPLKLGLMRSLGAKRMSHLLKLLAEQIEHLELTLVDPQEPCDARIVLANSVKESEHFISIWQDEYRLAVPCHWSIAHKSSIAIDALDSMPFIHRSPCDTQESLKEAMTEQGIHFQSRANIRTIEYAHELVCAGIGATLLPNWREIQADKRLSLLNIDDIYLIKNIGLAYKKQHKQSPLIQGIMQVCQGESITH